MPEFLISRQEKGNGQENFEEGVCRERIIASLEQIGFKGKIREELISRMILLEQGSLFNKDDRQVAVGVGNVLNFLEEHRTSLAPDRSGVAETDKDQGFITTAERKINGRVASLLHDIGKSGPVDASTAGQTAVIQLFALENVNAPNRSISEVVADSFTPEESKALLKNLSACSVDPGMTMRQFWDRHAVWTHDILEKYPDGLNEHIRIIAGSHHIDKGIDPYRKEAEPTQSSPGIIKTRGDEIDDLQTKALIVVDNYQAAVRRSGLDHEAAIAWVYNHMVKFSEDDSLRLVIEAVDKLGQQEKIFS